MSRSNFRVKVDLSRYYQDARRFCWIFIDGSKVLKISHMKQHITNLFNISEPYHLCLNNADYLPPAEDVRIIKEDETLIVIPGSGLEDEVQLSTNFSSRHDYDMYQGTKPFCDKESQTVEFPITKHNISTKDVNTQSNGFLSDSKQDISSNDVTFHSIRNDTEGDSDVEFKTLDSNITANHSLIQKEPISTKGKRKRYRKGKKNTSIFLGSAINESITKKKPKIIDSVVIPSGKHIRFSPFESNNAELSDHVNNDISKNDQCIVKTPSTKDLSTLLALRLSSTPLTFTNTKIEKEIEKTEDIPAIEQKKMNVSSEKLNETLNNIVEKFLTDKETSSKIKNQTLSHDQSQLPPLFKNDAETNDIIAFKMLNFGKDYSPQVSEIIVGQVLSFAPETDTFNLKILKGLDEVHFEKIPVGKFSIPEGENDSVVRDTINISYSKMIEPLLVKKSSPNYSNIFL